MPDFQNFSITSLGNVSVTVPRFAIEARLTDSQTQAAVADYTGAVNRIVFPNDLGALLPTAADKLAFVQYIAAYLIQKKAGL